MSSSHNKKLKSNAVFKHGMKKLEVIVPNGRERDVHEELMSLNVGGMSYYRIEGSGRVKADPVVEATHPAREKPEYISRTKVEAVIKDYQVEQIISKLRERLGNDPQGGKIFVLDVPVAADIKTGHTGEPVI
ncbi:MAG: P-II family nitrogen regulator [Nitrososphaeraceae archaeon]